MVLGMHIAGGSDLGGGGGGQGGRGGSDLGGGGSYFLGGIPSVGKVWVACILVGLGGVESLRGITMLSSECLLVLVSSLELE